MGGGALSWLGRVEGQRVVCENRGRNSGYMANKCLHFLLWDAFFSHTGSIVAAAMAVALTNLGMVVPLFSRLRGAYHYLVVLALGAYGVEREIALGYGW